MRRNVENSVSYIELIQIDSFNRFQVSEYVLHCYNEYPHPSLKKYLIEGNNLILILGILFN